MLLVVHAISRGLSLFSTKGVSIRPAYKFSNARFFHFIYCVCYTSAVKTLF